MITLTRSEIEELIDWRQAAIAVEDAYRATSLGQVTLPPVGHITFPERDADCHIKFGHMDGAPTFVIKVATGFPHNQKDGLQTGGGVVLVMSAHNGQIIAVLHDEMILTDVRTGLGGAIASRLLARHDSKRMLVVGTGQQAQRQIEAHAALLPEAMSFEVWGRNTERADTLVGKLAATCDISRANDLAAAVRRADIIVTATGATQPLIRPQWVQDGTHITAVGADAPGKQELDVALVAHADVLAVDHIAQCLDHGEVSHAAKAGLIHARDVKEIGTLLSHRSTARTNAKQITIADLTGIAAQDIAMANSVLSALTEADGPAGT